MESYFKSLINFKRSLNESISSKEIVDFFTTTKDVVDDKVHKFADENNIEHSDLETQIYSFLVDFFQAGLYYKKLQAGKKIDFDSKELSMGMEVEMEHTTNELIAEKIAKDHLCEDSNYYTHLREMENKY